MKKVLLSLVLVISLFALSGCNKDTKTLNNIVDKLNSLETYKQMKTMGTFTEKVDKNVLTITIKSEYENGSYDFTLKDDFLTTTVEEDKTYGAFLFLELAEAIALTNNMDGSMMTSFINGAVVDNIKTEYFKYSSEDNKNTYSISINKFDLEPLLKDMNISETDLDFFNKFDSEENNSSIGSKGNYRFYIEGNKNDSEIIFMERKGFSENAYKNLLTLIKYFYSKNLSEKFAAKYTKIEEKSFDKFTIKYLDKNSEDITDHFENINFENYKFIKISYNR